MEGALYAAAICTTEILSFTSATRNQWMRTMWPGRSTSAHRVSTTSHKATDSHLHIKRGDAPFPYRPKILIILHFLRSPLHPLFHHATPSLTTAAEPVHFLHSRRISLVPRPRPGPGHFRASPFNDSTPCLQSSSPFRHHAPSLFVSHPTQILFD